MAAVFAWTKAIAAQLGWDFEVWSGGDQREIQMVKTLATARRFGGTSGPTLVASDTVRFSALSAAWRRGRTASLAFDSHDVWEATNERC